MDVEPGSGRIRLGCLVQSAARLRKKWRPFSPAQHRQQTETRLALIGLLLLMGVGGGLVRAFYGRTAAVTAIACLLVGAGLFGLLWLILILLELWVKKE